MRSDHRGGRVSRPRPSCRPQHGFDRPAGRRLGVNVDGTGRGPATPDDEQALGGISGHESAALQRRVVGHLEDALARRRFENDVRVIWAAQDDADR